MVPSEDSERRVRFYVSEVFDGAPTKLGPPWRTAAVRGTYGLRFPRRLPGPVDSPRTELGDARGFQSPVAESRVSECGEQFQADLVSEGTRRAASEGTKFCWYKVRSITAEAM